MLLVRLTNLTLSGNGYGSVKFYRLVTEGMKVYEKQGLKSASSKEPAALIFAL